MVEIVDWWSRMTIAIVEIFDWWLRMTIAMVQKTMEYWEHDRYGRKNIGDSKWWLKGSKISSVDWWTAGIENTSWQLRTGKDWKQAEDNTLMLTWSSILRIHFR